MIDPSNPHQQLERPFDVYMLPVGLDVYTATITDLKHVVVAARYPGEAGMHPEVMKLRRRFYVVDSVPQGTPSAIARAVVANARRQADAAGRAEWEAGGSQDLVRSIGISRPLGG